MMYITKNEPTSAMGIAIIGISVVRQLRRNIKITRITSVKAMRTVSRTSLTALRIDVVISIAISKRISLGSSLSSCFTLL